METNFSTGLIVAFSKGLVNFAFNSSTGTYEKKAEVIINDVLRDDYNSGHQFVCMFDNYIFYSTGQQILRFNTNLGEVISKKIRLLNLVDMERYLEYFLRNPAWLEKAEENSYEERRQHYLKEFQNDERTSITIGAIATNGKNLFVAGEGSLIVYNSDLEELSRVNLDIGPPVKNAHDILIYEDTVYLLDNIFHPIYILKINISDINNINTIEKDQQNCLYRHLDDQWLNPRLDQWLITAGRDVLIYSMSEEKRLFSIITTYDSSNISYLRFEQKRKERKERLKKQEEFILDFSDEESYVGEYEVVEYDHEINQRAAQQEAPRPKIKKLYTIDEARIEESLRALKESETEEEIIEEEFLDQNGLIIEEEKFLDKDSLILEEGFLILAITNLPPIWAVVVGKEKKRYLAKVESENHEISFSDFLDLDLTRGKFLIKSYANYLFIVTRWGKSLRIIDIEGQAKIVFSQEFSFSDSQFGKIIDMCPY